MKYIGEDIGALPSRQLVAGKSQYVGDLQLDGLLHMAVLRRDPPEDIQSGIQHARSRARRPPGTAQARGDRQ